MTIKLISHALRMVFGDLAGALRVTGLLYLLSQAVVILPPLLLNGTYSINDPFGVTSPGFGLVTFAVVIVTLILSIILSTWMAVAWHRYILLNETGLSYPKGKVGSYFWTGFGYGILCFLPAILFAIVIGMVVGPEAIECPLAIGVLTVLVSFLFLRIAMGLPGLCVDNNVVFRESWRMTAPLSSAIFGVALIAGVVAVLSTYATMALGGSLVVALIFSIIIGWVQLVVTLSVLTTVYGVVVEGRQLT